MQQPLLHGCTVATHHSILRVGGAARARPARELEKVRRKCDGQAPSPSHCRRRFAMPSSVRRLAAPPNCGFHSDIPCRGSTVVECLPMAPKSHIHIYRCFEMTNSHFRMGPCATRTKKPPRAPLRATRAHRATARDPHRHRVLKEQAQGRAHLVNQMLKKPGMMVWVQRFVERGPAAGRHSERREQPRGPD